MNATYDPDWKGPNPYFLVIREAVIITLPGDAPQTTWVSTVIDLNTRWLTDYAHLLRVPGIWMLCSKERSSSEGELVPVLIMEVVEGEQPYYVAKHVGVISMSDAVPQEVVCYGIGKKRRDGYVDRLWIMPNGMVCGGEDVYRIGSDMVKGKL